MKQSAVKYCELKCRDVGCCEVQCSEAQCYAVQCCVMLDLHSSILHIQEMAAGQSHCQLICSLSLHASDADS